MKTEQFIRAFGNTRHPHLFSDGRDLVAITDAMTIRMRGADLPAGSYHKAAALAALVSGRGEGDTDLPEFNRAQGATVDVPVSVLADALPFAACKDIRYHLNGVCVQPGRIVATDGHTLRVIPVPELAGVTDECIIPREMIEAAIKCKAEVIRVPVAKAEGKRDWITFDVGDVSACSMPVDGKFPDCDRVIPDRALFVHAVPLPTAKEAREYAKKAALVGGKFPAIVIRDGHISAQCVDGDLLPLRNSCPPDAHIGLQAAYFARVAECGDVLHIRDENSAAAVYPADGGVVVVMPTRY